MAGWNVLEYVEALEGQIFPPLLVEVVLKSGQTYFVKNAFRPDPELDMVGLLSSRQATRVFGVPLGVP